MQREAHDQQRAQRQLAERQRGADRQALAEVVEADADRDQERRDPGGAEAALAASQPGAERLEAEPGGSRADREQRHALERSRQLGRRLQPLVDGVDQQEEQQPEGEREQEVERARPSRPTSGYQSRPSATGITPT